MHWIDWLITIVPIAVIIWMAVYSRKYVRGVVDYLAAGRVAGRYVMATGDMVSALSVLTLVALVEQKYHVGYAVSFWDYLTIPVALVMGLTGYCVYRFRETRALSFGQFLELRYNRPLRVVAALVRTISEMLTNAIGPAISVNFFIYFLGLSHKISLWGVNLPTFALLVAGVLALAITILWPGGRISLLITDSFQAILSYPIFIVITGYILLKFSWSDVIAPVMLDRVDGESFLNPFDIEKLRDFNLFAVVVHLVAMVLNKASWIGNDTTSCGRTPHEQKMAGILGTWRTGFSGLMCLLIAIMVISLMTHAKFADTAHTIRQQLSGKVAAEVVADETVRKTLDARLAALPAQRHQIGVDMPLSHADNLDTPWLDTAREVVAISPEGNHQFQNFRTLYKQMMLPVALRNILPIGLMGLFCLLMVMLMVSTDDGRIFNSASTIVQDIILPFLKRPLTPREHLFLLRAGTLGVTVFFFVSCLLFTHLDYISMFITIMGSVWLGGAGPIMIFGLYSRFGTTTGAFCSLIFGSGFSILGLIFQRNWARTIYPWLDVHGWVAAVGSFLETISAPFGPYIVWKMDAVKFPINSFELYFLAMISGMAAYVVGSLLTRKAGGYNLNRLLHRGIYAVEGEKKNVTPWTWRTFVGKLVGITPEYTRGDKIIAWATVFYGIVYKFGLCYLGVLVWNLISPWPKEWWSIYFFITHQVMLCVIGSVSTIWFFVGGVVDLRRLFKDLATRRENDPLDNGVVEGHLSIVDKADFKRRSGSGQDG